MCITLPDYSPLRVVWVSMWDVIPLLHRFHCGSPFFSDACDVMQDRACDSDVACSVRFDPEVVQAPKSGLQDPERHFDSCPGTGMGVVEASFSRGLGLWERGQEIRFAWIAFVPEEQAREFT